MHPSKVELAVLNNTRWYEALFTAHGLASQTDGRVWHSIDTPPPFHSNLVVLSPVTTLADIAACAAQIESRPRRFGWSLKDSYASLDLATLGFSELFRADWIWRDPPLADSLALGSRLSFTTLTESARLAEWEQAWSGDTRNHTAALAHRQFPDSLLGSSDLAFFAGMRDGNMVAGGIANRSPGVVGLSNLFSPPALLADTWIALTAAVSAAFPGVPIVGYERGADLSTAKGAGFAPIGKLRVWCRQI